MSTYSNLLSMATRTWPNYAVFIPLLPATAKT